MDYFTTHFSFRLQPPAVIYVEYDSRGKRAWKRFADPYAARRFYMAKDRAGKKPKVLRVPL